MIFMADDHPKKTILFVCRNNSGRSQMAEGLFKNLYGDKFHVSSGGSDPKEVNPLTIQIMGEIGIDISGQTSTNLKEYQGREFDYVVNLCGDKDCALFLNGKKVIYHEFKDPKTYHNGELTTMDVFRLIRDEIKDWLEGSLIHEI